MSQSESITVNGVKLSYQLLGDIKKPLVVCCNGVLFRYFYWKPLVQQLSDEYCYLLWDCRGQFASDKPEQDFYSMDEHVEDLRELLEHLQFNQVFHILGISFGASLAIEFALKYPQRVDTLMLLTPLAQTNPGYRQRAKDWLAIVDEPKKFAEFTVRSVYSEKYLADVNIFEERCNELSDISIELRQGFKRLVKGMMQINYVDKLNLLQQKTCVICTEEDFLHPGPESLEMFSVMPNAESHMLPGGHAVHVEQAEALVEILRHFLNSLNS